MNTTYGAQRWSPESPIPDVTGTARAEPRKTVGYKLVLLLWLIYMFEPQTYVANAFNQPVVARILLILICSLALFLFLKPPRKAFLLPYGAIVAYLFVVSLFAINTGYARIPAVQAGLFYVVAVGLATFVRSPRQILPLLTAFMVGQFLWWAPWGLSSGKVWWHGEYGNPDGYGPLMTFGIAAAFPYAVATKSKRARQIAVVVGVLCVAGMVASFARGAFLAGIAVMGWLWLNAPRKGVATGFLVVAGLGILVAGSLVSGGTDRGAAHSNFFDEMSTILSEDEQVTADGGRGALRTMAVEVWKAAPMMGVGGRNFGVYAAAHFGTGMAKGDFSQAPGRLYEAALHNSFLQVLAEYGLIGSVLYIWLLADFFRRNHRLRSPPFRAAWADRGGSRMDLRWVSIGLTGMMISILANAWFYNVLQLLAIPTLVAINALVYEIAKPENRRVPSPTSPLAAR